jgi:hypothetical protein
MTGRARPGDPANKLARERGNTERTTPIAPVEERRKHGTELPKKWKRYGG